MRPGLGRRPFPVEVGPNPTTYPAMRKTVYGTAFILAALGTAVFVIAPAKQDFDVRDAPEAPPLSALASLVSTSTDGQIVQVDTMRDEGIDVRAHHVVTVPSS